MSTPNCYLIEEIPLKADSMRPHMKSEHELVKKRSQDARLHEIEQQLHVAENRCNTLKGQLDYMKMLYSEPNGDKRKPTTAHQVFESKTKPRPLSEYKSERPEKDRRNGGSQYGDKMASATSPRIGTCIINSITSIHPSREIISAKGVRMKQNKEMRVDESGEQTIQRILTGINESVNRISHLNNHMEIDCEPNTIKERKVNKKKDFSKLEDTRSVKMNRGDNTNVRPYRTCSDTLISSVASIYAGTAKIPASNNLKRKLIKPHTSNRLTEKDSLRAIKRKAKQVIKTHDKKIKTIPAETKSTLGKMYDDKGSCVGKSRKRRPKVKRALSHSTYAQGTLISIDMESCNTYKNPFKSWNSDNLVELYHNKAIKTGGVESQSDDESIANAQKNKKHRSHQPKTVDYVKRNATAVGLPKFYSNSPQTYETISDNSKYGMNQLQQGDSQGMYNTYHASIPPTAMSNQMYQENLANSTSQSMYPHSFYGKHYEMPTLSTRLKQVTRHYAHQFNFRSIPFIPARSTSPSHNLGLNIQQVLSIIKSRQPVSGISPTLAHNMGLVAQSGGSFVSNANIPLHGIFSRVGSRHSNVGGVKKICPLLRHATACAESELADVPEHPCETEPFDTPITSPPTQRTTTETDIDNDLLKRMSTEWDQAVSKNNRQIRCTCMPRKAVNYNKVLNQYLDGNGQLPTYLQSLNQSAVHSSHEKTGSGRPKQYKSAFSIRSADNSYPPDSSCVPPSESQTINSDSRNHSKHSFSRQLVGKMRGLRDVLATLHNDFQSLNDKYDVLSEQLRNNSSDNDPELLKQLENMDKELNAKEEEITVVISLYKEVLALKEQVRTLKERTSVLSMSVHGGVTGSQKSKISTEPTVTLRLTKLLRQIQHFQGLLKQQP